MFPLKNLARKGLIPSMSFFHFRLRIQYASYSYCKVCFFLFRSQMAYVTRWLTIPQANQVTAPSASVSHCLQRPAIPVSQRVPLPTPRSEPRSCQVSAMCSKVVRSRTCWGMVSGIILQYIMEQTLVLRSSRYEKDMEICFWRCTSW